MAIEFEKISEDRSWQIFDDAAHRLLGIDGATFAKRWDHGDYSARDAETQVLRVAMLRPGGR